LETKQSRLGQQMKILICILLFTSYSIFAQNQPTIGMNITEMGYDTRYMTLPAPLKSKAQIAIDEAVNLGMKHVVLNVRAHMIGPRSSDIRFVFNDKNEEIEGLKDLIAYAHQQKLTVGLRPILLVLGPNREFPYTENGHLWWHGNIKPDNPDTWFVAFQNFVLFYADNLALDIEEFTIGAEMQSMTVGMGSNDNAYLIGQPEKWLQLLRSIRQINSKIKITYDINFPETLVPLTNNIGGEFERWRHLIVDLENSPSAEIQRKRTSIIQLWKEFDFIGLDFYRYLSNTTLNIPTDFNVLTEKLTSTALGHATQIDNALSEIEFITSTPKKLVIKEIGYRSVKGCFVNPASYSSSGGTLNIDHQAASYKAIANAFIAPSWPWFKGIYLWDISTDPKLKGPKDIGFSPLGKPKTLEIIKKDFLGL
jgi:hypothetical protein